MAVSRAFPCTWKCHVHTRRCEQDGTPRQPGLGPAPSCTRSPTCSAMGCGHLGLVRLLLIGIQALPDFCWKSESSGTCERLWGGGSRGLQHPFSLIRLPLAAPATLVFPGQGLGELGHLRWACSCSVKWASAPDGQGWSAQIQTLLGPTDGMYPD